MTRVLIADDHAVVRSGVALLLATTPDIRIAGEAKSAGEALALARDAHWDLVLLDISLPDGSGLEVLKQIKAAKPNLPVVIFSMCSADEYAAAAFAAGASAYLTKDCAYQEIFAAIRHLAKGGNDPDTQVSRAGPGTR
jgi:DNA-binding NarL/FixJ family response regulator